VICPRWSEDAIGHFKAANGQLPGRRSITTATRRIGARAVVRTTTARARTFCPARRPTLGQTLFPKVSIGCRHIAIHWTARWWSQPSRPCQHRSPVSRECSTGGIGDGQFVERRPVGVFGCFGVGGLGELFLQSTVIAYWFKVVLAMMWKPVTTSGSMATTVSA
jgi:hypothetical protein